MSITHRAVNSTDLYDKKNEFDEKNIKSNIKEKLFYIINDFQYNLRVFIALLPALIILFTFGGKVYFFNYLFYRLIGIFIAIALIAYTCDLFGQEEMYFIIFLGQLFLFG